MRHTAFTDSHGTPCPVHLVGRPQPRRHRNPLRRLYDAMFLGPTPVVHGDTLTITHTITVENDWGGIVGISGIEWALVCTPDTPDEVAGRLNERATGDVT